MLSHYGRVLGSIAKLFLSIGRRLAALHFDIKNQTHIADPIGMQRMVWPPWFRGVVTDFGIRLMTIQQLDCGVDVENLGCTQSLARALTQRCIHSGGTFR